MTRSLWSRVLVGAAVGITVVLAAAGLTIYLLVRMWLLNEFRSSLAGKAHALAALVEQEGGEVELEMDERDVIEFTRTDRPEYLQVWLVGGGELYRSRSLGQQELERVGGELGEPAFRPVTLPDGRRGWLAGVTFVPRHKHTVGPLAEVTLVVARDARDVDRALARLALLLMAVCAGAIFLSVGLLDWFVTRGIRPVSRLAGEIGDMGATRLSAQIELPDAPTELLPVVDRLNDLLGRLDATFEREKAFTANVAHELRTPLTGLLTTLDLALSRPRTAPAYRQALAKCHLICCQTRTLVDNLLSLARADAGHVEVASERVRLGDLLEECWMSLEQQATARALGVDWRLGEGCELDTDPELLRLVLFNVLGNAVAHADQGGSVHIESSCDGSRLELRITNSGSTLGAEQARHVFERFWQGDAARAATGVHCGLGLALAEKLVSLLGGSIAAESVAGGEFTVRLAFEKGG